MSEFFKVDSILRTGKRRTMFINAEEIKAIKELTPEEINHEELRVISDGDLMEMLLKGGIVIHFYSHMGECAEKLESCCNLRSVHQGEDEDDFDSWRYYHNETD